MILESSKLKNKIKLMFLFGFMTPPLVWNFMMWYSNVVSTQQLKTLATHPVQGVYAIIYISLIFIYLSKMLKNIPDNNLELSHIYQEKSMEEAQKTILRMNSKLQVYRDFYCCSCSGEFIRRIEKVIFE